MNVQVGITTNEDIFLPRNQKIAKVTVAEEVIPDHEMDVDETGRKIVYLQEQNIRLALLTQKMMYLIWIWVAFQNSLKN